MKASFRRMWAILSKEWIQMRRDRLTFAMILGIPVIQLVLFGFAINTDPRHLPAAVYLEESSPVIQRVVEALETSSYFDVVLQTRDHRDSSAMLASGQVLMVFTFPVGFTRDLVRGQRPSLLVEADATDPVATGSALAQLPGILDRALKESLSGPLAHLASRPQPVNLLLHRLYNPESITQFNIVPGLLGVILTMTMVLITSIAMTREVERGTMENLLAMPTRPFEVMAGKIAPYVVVGLLQTAIVVWSAMALFHVPFLGSPRAFLLGLGLFILANLALGFTFSTVARSQLQAMQMTFFFFLPSILLSGFMFPFQGMPGWARMLGEMLPLTHFLRIVRGVMLKAADTTLLWPEFVAIGLFLLATGALAILRYRTTLD